MRAQCGLPRGIGRLIPCGIGGRSLSSDAYWMENVWTWTYIPAYGRPLWFLFSMSFWCYSGALQILVVFCFSGVLPLRNCARRFTCWVPTWRSSPSGGHVADFVTEGVRTLLVFDAADIVSGAGGNWAGGPGGCWKSVRLMCESTHHVPSHPCQLITMHSMSTYLFQVFESVHLHRP